MNNFFSEYALILILMGFVALAIQALEAIVLN